MKSKTVFIIVLFSLLLNVMHDFIITHQIEEPQIQKSHLTQLDAVKKHVLSVDDLHDMFHLLAIFFIEKVYVSFVPENPQFFIDFTSASTITNNTFRPPIV